MSEKLCTLRKIGGGKLEPLTFTLSNDNEPSDSYRARVKFDSSHPWKQIKYVSKTSSYNFAYLVVTNGGSYNPMTVGQSYDIEGKAFEVSVFRSLYTFQLIP